MRGARAANRRRSLLALGATGILAAGCGNSSTTTSPTSSAPSSTRTSAKARATAFAHAVNLVAADVPGMSLIGVEGEAAAPKQAAVQAAQCAGAASPEQRISKIHSAAFTHFNPHIRIRSAVEVLPSVAVAAHNNTAERSARGRACLVRFLGQTLPAQTVQPARYGQISVSSLPNLLPGAQGSFGLRLRTTLTTRELGGRPAKVPIYLDEYGFISGPAEINLTATGFSTPVPVKTEQRLLTLLYSRTQAHKL